MHVLGYLVTLANIQSFAKNGGIMEDLSVRVSPLGVLAAEIKSLPQFNLENFRSDGYCRVGNVGKYLSKNLQEYLFNGDGDAADEGLILTLQFKDKSEIHDTESSSSEESLTMFMPRGVVSDEDKQAIHKYATQDALNFGNHRRSDRSVGAY